MHKQLETEIKVGIFIAVGLGLIMTAILLLGGTESLFARKNRYTAHFQNVEGLISGAKVILGGVPVGTVDAISFDHKQRKIVVGISVDRSSADWIRTDSTVEIATQGVLGDKYLNLEMGTQDQPVLAAGSDIPSKTGKDLSQFLSKGDQLMISLNNIGTILERILKNFERDNRSDAFFKGISKSAENLSQASEKINKELDQIQLKKAISNLAQIFEKINNGSGTIGALINDSGLYEEVKALMGGVNRNRIMRNLVRQAIKESDSSGNENLSDPSGRIQEKK